MEGTTKPRFVPCPWCKGSGGFCEPVTDLGEGPQYDCAGCDGSGNMYDYIPRKAAALAKYEREVVVICECTHDATLHYEGHDACAFASLDEIEPDGTIKCCSCKLSREYLMKEVAA